VRFFWTVCLVVVVIATLAAVWRPLAIAFFVTLVMLLAWRGLLRGAERQVARHGR